MTLTNDKLTAGLAQLAPAWLDRDKTIEKITKYIEKATKKGCELVVFGEALLPGYPFWVSKTGGADFDSPVQKAIYAHYFNQAASIREGHLDPFCTLAMEGKITMVVGCIERADEKA